MIFEKKRVSSGFTLAELLVALVLLGVVSAFVIPKVLQSSATQERRAKLLETVSVLENAFAGHMSAGGYPPLLRPFIMANGGSLPNATLDQYYLPILLQNSGTTVLNSNSQNSSFNGLPNTPYAGLTDHPCSFSFTGPQAPFALYTGWVKLPSGVIISGISGYEILFPDSPNQILCIDVNGASGPNLPGQDIFFGNFNYDGDFDGNGNLLFRPSQKRFFWGDPQNGAFIYTQSHSPACDGATGTIIYANGDQYCVADQANSVYAGIYQ